MLSDGLASYTPDLSKTEGWNVTVGSMNVTTDGSSLSFETADGNESYNPAYALAVDSTSPALKNGEIVANLTYNFAGRAGIVFRYQDKNNYAAVVQDLGTWQVKKVVNGKETTETYPVEGVSPQQGVTMKITFSGENLQVSLNDKTVYNKAFLADLPEAGQLGIRTWGYAGNYAKLKVSSLSYNQIPDLEQDEHGNYMVTFTDEMKRGGWSQQTNDANTNGLTFTDGEGENGYAILAAGPDSAGDGKTIFADTRSPRIANGFIEADITNMGEGRVGLFFRYNSVDDTAGLLYDVGGTWKITKGSGGEQAIAGLEALQKGTPYHIRIEYVGDSVTVKLTNKTTGNVTEAKQRVEGITQKEGQLGARVWGYGSGDSMGKLKLDNVVNGYFNAVLLTPDIVQSPIPFRQE